ncbi:MAG: hypothetical protein JSS89_12010 [Bacteroidetes bacterium]|nr:hypothetical protein [Bacteroidota bacterium]
MNDLFSFLGNPTWALIVGLVLVVIVGPLLRPIVTLISRSFQLMLVRLAKSKLVHRSSIAIVNRTIDVLAFARESHSDTLPAINGDYESLVNSGVPLNFIDTGIDAAFGFTRDRLLVEVRMNRNTSLHSYRFQFTFKPQYAIPMIIEQDEQMAEVVKSEPPQYSAAA